MRESIKVRSKRKPGRPATGKDPLFAVRMPVELMASVEAWAKRDELTRSEAIRRLIELGLKARR
jgi:hypothetical protein